MMSYVPGMDPQMVKNSYWAENRNKSNKTEIKHEEDNKINLLRTVFKERKDHLEHICSKYKAKYDSTFTAENDGRNDQQRSKVRNWKTGRGARDPRISKNPVLTNQEYYSAKDKQLNQRFVLTSHLLDNTRKVMYCWNHKIACSFWIGMVDNFCSSPAEP